MKYIKFQNKISKVRPPKQIKVKVYNLIDQKIFKVKRYLHKLNKEDLSNYTIVTKLIYYICQYSEGNVEMLIFLKDFIIIIYVLNKVITF